MIKILFVNTDLRGGGAEKVLVNLVNKLDYTKYDVTLFTVFKEGINRDNLNPQIKQKWFFKNQFRGYNRLALLFSPERLFKLFIKEKYDAIISYLEGFPSRIVSGCIDKDTKLVSWIHLEKYNKKEGVQYIGYEFRGKQEAINTYNKFDKIVCVSETVKECFLKCVNIPYKKVDVIYNLLDIDDIENRSKEIFLLPKTDKFKLCTIGRLNPQKGYDRLLRIVKKLIHEDSFDFELQILGIGPLEQKFKKYVTQNNLESIVSFLGFQKNPYPYIKNADIFVCSSYQEGYSTVVTEAVILGTPVITTDCSGMREILDNGNSGIIVNNSEEDLYKGLKKLLSNKQIIKELAIKTKSRAEQLKNRNNVDIFQNYISELLKK